MAINVNGPGNRDGNRIDGTPGNDTLIRGTIRRDYISGLEGDDTIEGGFGNDTINGGEGNDTATYARSYEAVQINLGSQGPQHGGDAEGDELNSIENVIGSAYNDTLTGNGLDNRFEGGAGGDIIDGGGGSDTTSYENAPSSMSITLGEGSADGSANVDSKAMSVMVNGKKITINVRDYHEDTLRNIENVIGTKFGDHINGNSAENRLEGRGGDDTIDGGGGDDELYGDAGNDRILGGEGDDRNDGGKGIDTVDYSASADDVHVSLRDNFGVGGDAHNDTFYFIENIIGSAHGDSLIGDKYANALSGNGGNDVNEGGIGRDILSGGEGIDTLSYMGSSAGVKVSLLNGTASGGDATGDKFVGFENLTGSAHDDVLTGSKEDNKIYGGKGNDKINGDEGADRIIGEDGNDTLTGGGGADAFIFNVPPAYVAAYIGFTPGHDTITDFDIDTDHLEFLFADSLDELSFSQVGSDTIIEYKHFEGSITLEDVQLSNLMETQGAILLV